jgi:selenide,water dikinase
MRDVGPVCEIVLLGGGHAHVEALRRFARRPLTGVRLSLVSRERRTPYSGMLPGVIRGDYAASEAHVDLAPLADACGARLVLSAAAGIDLAARRVLFADRQPVAFDMLSLDVGGEPAAAQGGIPVKPIGRLLDRLAELERVLEPGDRVAVVGAGAGGTELALALATRLRVALICAEAEPLAGAPRAVRAAVRGALAEAGAELLCGVSAGAFRAGRLELSDESSLPVAAALWATGARGPAWLAAAGLACDEAGCVIVDATLRSLSHPFVFAAGDCAALLGRPRPKAGVWAVRAGPPLAANLRAAATGRRLRRWRPQRRALVILGLGRGRAVAWLGGWSVSGRLVWRWKDWIDRRWVARCARLAAAGGARENRAQDGGGAWL